MSGGLQTFKLSCMYKSKLIWVEVAQVGVRQPDTTNLCHAEIRTKATYTVLCTNQSVCGKMQIEVTRDVKSIM